MREGLRLCVSARARDDRLRRRVAGRLEGAAGPAGPDAERRILLIAAVLRSPLALPCDGVRAAGRLASDAGGDALSEELLRVEALLGMLGRHRPAARAIADGTIVARRRSGSP